MLKGNTMVPLLFPHTRIGQTCLGELLEVFGQIRLQLACDGDLPAHLQAAADGGRLLIERPVSEDGTDIRHLAHAYRKWLEDTRGMEPRVPHLYRDTPPLVDDTATARLRSQILSIKDGGAAARPDDSRRMAQLFLLTAEDWVAEMAALEADMDTHLDKERALFTQLHGDPEELAMFTHMAGHDRLVDPCVRMTPEWITAWCRLVAEHSDIAGVWLTFSDAVVAWMREVFGDTRPMEAIPRGQEDRFSHLENRLAQGATGSGGGLTEQELEVPDAPGEDTSLAGVVYRFPGVSPRYAVNRLMHPGKSASPSPPEDGDRSLVLVRWHLKSI
jgi:hypothetical protein